MPTATLDAPVRRKYTKSFNPNHCTLPDHVERTLTRKQHKQVKACLERGSDILDCSLMNGVQPMQVAYAQRTNSYREYLLCKKQLAEPKKSWNVAISYPQDG